MNFQIIFSLCFCLYSCAEVEHNIATTHHFEKKGRLAINLDSLTPIDATSVNPFYFDDTLCLFVVNKLFNSVDVYDDISGKLKKRFVFDREGPNGIAQVYNAAVKNKDSIYIVGKFHLVTSKMIDWDGNMTSRRPIDFDWRGEFDIINHASNIILNGDFMYVTIGALFNLDDPNNFDQSISYEYRYDFRNKTMEKLPIYEPHSYMSKPHNLFYIVPSRVLDDRGRLVHSWGEEEYIEVRNLTGLDSIQRHYAHIKSFGKPLKGTKQAGQPVKAKLREALNHSRYVKILFDPYRKVFYRIAILPTGNYKESDLDHWTAFGRNRLGIIALNENFDIIGYTVLEGEMYDCYRAFVGKEGIYISMNNIYRKDFDENLLEYSIFELVEN